MVLNGYFKEASYTVPNRTMSDPAEAGGDPSDIFDCSAALLAGSPLRCDPVTGTFALLQQAAGDEPLSASGGFGRRKANFPWWHNRNGFLEAATSHTRPGFPPGRKRPGREAQRSRSDPQTRSRFEGSQ
jgi:hypothetical protein